MKRVLAGLLILGLAACGDGGPTEAGENRNGVENPTVFEANDDGGTFADARFSRVTIDGMDCIVYKDPFSHHKAYSGLTCDWSQR